MKGLAQRFELATLKPTTSGYPCRPFILSYGQTYGASYWNCTNDQAVAAPCLSTWLKKHIKVPVREFSLPELGYRSATDYRQIRHLFREREEENFYAEQRQLSKLKRTNAFIPITRLISCALRHYKAPYIVDIGWKDRTRTRVIQFPKLAPDQLGYFPIFQLLDTGSWTRAFRGSIG